MAKRDYTETITEVPAPKRARLLDGSSGDESDPLEAPNGNSRLKINKDYASRFEHNKKRAEKQRLEEKYGPLLGSEEESSSSEDDEEAEFVNDDVDRSIMATIQALRSKDPRIYDKASNFFDSSKMVTQPVVASGHRKEKGMTLKDYHRENLLNGDSGEADAVSAPLKSHNQEQKDLKEALISAAADDSSENDDSDDEDGFLVRKSAPEPARRPRSMEENVHIDAATADKDPETFLSNFLTSNTWRSMSPSRFQPFESDDEDDMQRADEIEEAYNRRFEDPKKFNATIQTYDRPTIAKHSVRREETSGRQKARQAERAAKDAEKAERIEDRARLKRLKIEEMERKVKQIRKSAGVHGKNFALEDWADVLEGDFDDDQWEAEMNKRFNDEYYRASDQGQSDDEAGTGEKKKIRKPKWDDDIEVKDIVPDFSDEDQDEAATSAENSDAGNEQAGDIQPGTKKRNDKKARLKAREDAKRTAKRDRRLIENMVESSMADKPLASAKNARAAFIYRETSPTSFGLSARDILLADDRDLNAYAGIKKLHAFRDPDKKRKDKKNLSKKARLRQWRKDTFGNEYGPDVNPLKDHNEEAENDSKLQAPELMASTEQAEEASKKKKKRSRKSKKAANANTDTI